MIIPRQSIIHCHTQEFCVGAVGDKINIMNMMIVPNFDVFTTSKVKISKITY
jgi:hypothetical protein